MTHWRSAIKLRGPIGILGLNLAFSAAFILLFRHCYGYRLMVVPLHLLIVLSLYGAIFLFSGMLVSIPRFRTWRFARIVVAALPAALGLIQFLLYAVDFTANGTWGENVTYRIVAGYATELPSLLNSLAVSSHIIYAAVVLLTLVLLSVYWRVSASLFAGYCDLFTLGRAGGLLSTPRRAIFTVTTLALLVACQSSFLWVSLRQPGTTWQGEPIVDLFKIDRMFEPDPVHDAITQDAKLARAQYPRGVPSNRKNVIVIMCDSLRADHMGAYGYSRPTTPFISSLVRSGAMSAVGMTLSTCSETRCGVLSMLSSRNYESLSDYNFKIYDLLQAQGYRAYFVTAGDHTNYHGYRDLLGRSMDLFFDAYTSRSFSTNDDHLVLEGLEKVPPFSGTPAFFFLFLMSTHHIGVKFGEYERYKPATIDGIDLWAVTNGESTRQTVINRYDNGVLQADAMIEKIYAQLEAKGYLRDSLVVITSDHGESLGERGAYLHSRTLYQEDITIPLLIHFDACDTCQNLTFARQIDIAPTLVDYLGLPVPACWQGVSLLHPPEEAMSFHMTPAPPPILPVRVVVYRSGKTIYKYMKSRTAAGDLHEELYELTDDPTEQRNLVNRADASLIGMLRQRLELEFPEMKRTP